jgi:hypothetical protein
MNCILRRVSYLDAYSSEQMDILRSILLNDPNGFVCYSDADFTLVNFPLPSGVLPQNLDRRYYVWVANSDISVVQSQVSLPF